MFVVVVVVLRLFSIIVFIIIINRIRIIIINCCKEMLKIMTRLSLGQYSVDHQSHSGPSEK